MFGHQSINESADVINIQFLIPIFKSTNNVSYYVIYVLQYVFSIYCNHHLTILVLMLFYVTPPKIQITSNE